MTRLDAWSLGMLGGFLLGTLAAAYALQVKQIDLARASPCPAGYVRVQERGPPTCVQAEGFLSQAQERH